VSQEMRLIVCAFDAAGKADEVEQALEGLTGACRPSSWAISPSSRRTPTARSASGKPRTAAMPSAR